MNDVKKLWQSRTFWFNVIAAIIDIAVYLQASAPQKYLPYITAVHAIGNIVLRYITDKPITSLL